MNNEIKMMDFEKKYNEDKLNILDVREAFEYKMFGHIPEAINMPLSKLEKSYTKLDKKIDYYIICASGARSNEAASFLKSKGYKGKSVMGGMNAWKGKKKR